MSRAPEWSEEQLMLLGEIDSEWEDDALGVYEVWWAANRRFPERLVSERLALAESTVRHLVVIGQARLHRGRWIGPEHERTTIPRDEADAVLRDWRTWVPEEGDVVWLDRS